jgi:hypothetical protein
VEHQEERVRNRYRGFSICIAFALASALSLLAQSDPTGVQSGDGVQLKVSDHAQPLLAALVEAPTIGGFSNESELPDAPSATLPAASSAEPTASPAIRRESSHGAPAAAMGGPLGVDHSVADWKYLTLTGAMFSASTANAELTLRCLNKHPSCNDVPPSLHSRVALYGIGIPADLGVAYLTYYMKRKHSHIWYVPAAAVTAANVFLSIRAYRWSQD